MALFSKLSQNFHCKSVLNVQAVIQQLISDHLFPEKFKGYTVLRAWTHIFTHKNKLRTAVVYIHQYVPLASYH